MSSNNTNINIIQDTGNKLSPKELFFKYLVYLPLFILCTAVSITIAYLYIRYKVPVYTSTISVLINDNSKGGSPSDDMMLEQLTLYKKKSNLANEVEVLKSTSMMERVVRSLGLNVVYQNEGKVRKSELYGFESIFKVKILHVVDSSTAFGLSFEKKDHHLIAKFDGKKQQIQNGTIVNLKNGSMQVFVDPAGLNDQYKYYATWVPVRSMAASLAGALAVAQLNREASILKISINTEMPQKGQDVLNQLVSEYRQRNIEEKNRVSDNTIQFVDDRLSIIYRELGSIEGGKQSFQQRHGLVDIVTQTEQETEQASAIRNKLDESQVQLKVMDMIRDYISTPARKYELVPSTLGIGDATLNSLIMAYNELQLKRAAELRSVPEAHPSIRLMDNQLEKIRTSIVENLGNLRYSSQVLANRLNNEYMSVIGKIREVPGQQRELAEIMRQQGIKEKLYLYLLQKREESAITRASAVGNASAIDEAISGGSPVSPNTQSIYRLAFICGLLIPLGIIYIRDLLNDKIVSRTDLVKATDTPIVGEVAHHVSMTRKFVVGMKDRSILSEQFRILRTNLQFLLTTAPTKNPVVLVTSTIAGEGKTFCSMNMAAVWAVAGKKTVILELDLRKPKISKALGLQRDIGLTNYILGNAKMEDLPQPNSEVPNLYIIGAGPIPPNPSEMIMDQKMDELFTYLRANFDIIIIDSAPVGLVSDSKILAKFADATLYVVRQRYTVKKQIAFVDDLYQNKVLPNMGLIVNDVKIGGANSYYGYGYGYGYGYTYNYNYSYSYGEEKKRTFVQKMRDLVGL
jgi:capsular exopolysaccharide synthesis family protein